MREVVEEGCRNLLRTFEIWGWGHARTHASLPPGATARATEFN